MCDRDRPPWGGKIRTPTLVENLRALADGDHDDHSLAEEAADKIEYLRGALREVVALHHRSGVNAAWDMAEVAEKTLGECDG